MSARPELARADSPSAGAQQGPADALIELCLVLAVQTLERRPDLLARLRVLLPVQGVSSTADATEHVSVAEYARHRRVSERTIRYQMKQMTEGIHFHHDGRKRRRVIIHQREADRWHADRYRPDCSSNIEDMAIDEVTRRRAQVALRRRKGK